MSRRLLKFVAPALLLAALPAMAVDGQIPIPNTPVFATPIVIGAPGSYVLTRNLMPTGPGPIINVAIAGAPGDVQIDLNGFVLNNSANPVDPVVRVTVGGPSELSIRNGTLYGGSAGIEVAGPARKLIVEDVKISDFTSAGPPGGITLTDVQNFAIRRTVIMDGPAGPGIFIAAGFPRQGTIEDNLIRRTQDGIDAIPGTFGLEISNNRLLEILPGGFFGAAINIDGGTGCLIAKNTIVGLPGVVAGIQLRGTPGCKIYNNVVSIVTTGIALVAGADDSLVLDNVVQRVCGDGLFIDTARNHVEGNVLNANGGCGGPPAGFGLHFGPASLDNTYGRNTARGNAGAPCVFVPPVEPCAAMGGGGGSFPPEFCNESPAGIGNTSNCDNLMPGPPRS